MALKIMAGKSNGKGHVHCPVNGWDCPYFGEHGICTMWPDSNPIFECDDFYIIWADAENERDYICYDDHEGEVTNEEVQVYEF